jgi:hypothetical protein
MFENMFKKICAASLSVAFLSSPVLASSGGERDYRSQNTLSSYSGKVCVYPGAKLHNRPKKSSSVVAVAKSGGRFTANAKAGFGSWYRVSTGGQTGFFHLGSIRKVNC